MKRSQEGRNLSEFSPYNLALNLLAMREHSAKELEKKLTQKGVLELDASDVLYKLQKNNLQSDRRFVEAFITNATQKGRGKVRMMAELRQHGISNEIVSDILDACEVDWHQLAYAVWQKKFNQQPKDLKEKAKQYRFMQQRGFTSSQIDKVFNSRNHRH